MTKAEIASTLEKVFATQSVPDLDAQLRVETLKYESERATVDKTIELALRAAVAEGRMLGQKDVKRNPNMHGLTEL